MEKEKAQYLDPTDWSAGPCWQVRECSAEWREFCPAWQYEAGQYCWEISMTYCQGRLQKNPAEKKKICYQCEVYQSILVKTEK